MRYSKLFEYENKGIHKRSVTVTDDLKVETQLIPKFGLPLLVKELSSIAIENEYQRRNPYKFDTDSDRHVYILFAEPKEKGYEINKKMILRRSNSGNIKIPEDTFLYDVLDYFVSIGLLNREYKFIGHVKENIGMTVTQLYSENELIVQGFKFPVYKLL